MERRGVGKRLTDGQRVEILKLFESGATVCEADVARRYGVTRSAIWRLRRSGQHILERYHEGDVQSRDERRRGSKNDVAAAAREAQQPVAVLTGPTGSSMLRPIPAVVIAPVQVNAADIQPQPQPHPLPQPLVLPPPPPLQQQTQNLESTVPLIYLSAKAIGSVQSPGLMNWERVSGHQDDQFFELVNDGVSVLQEGTYQINVDLQHSQPRQNYKFVFKVWHDKTLLGQCACPLRTKKEISLSLIEMRCHLPALAKLRIEFLSPGFAFHESRVVLRLVQ